MSSPTCQGLNTIHCQNCSMSDLCIPFSLKTGEISQLDNIIERKKPIQKGQIICAAGSDFKSLYAIRSGSFKSYTIADDGVEQVTSFDLAGDIIGFDSIGQNVHQSYSIALETSMVCEIPYQTIDQLSAHIPRLRQQIFRLMSEEIRADQFLFQLINKRSAQARLATFISTLGERHHERGFSIREFRLTMTRKEIGNYLGLTIESISRLFGQLKKQGIIELNGKYITIIDKDALAAVSIGDRLAIKK